jgi:hypothetical protein
MMIKKQVLFQILIIISLIISNSQINGQNPFCKDYEKKSNYLIFEIENFSNGQSDFSRLYSGEWILFSLSYSVYGFTNIAMIDSLFRPKAIKYIDLAIEKTLNINGFGYESLRDSQIVDTSASVLFYGHLNLMIGCYRLLTNDSKYSKLHDLITKSLYLRFQKSKYKLLESYSESVWIPDNCVAIASLYISDLVTQNGYTKYCTDWTDFIRENYLDYKTNLLVSTVNVQNGDKLEEPRGSMIGWSIFFISKFNYGFAKELYLSYKQKFSVNTLLFRLFRERYKKWTISRGDVDSGPLILGFSVPANGFAYGNAIAMRDYKAAKKIGRLIRLGAKKIDKDDIIRYKVRFLKFPISPLAESLLLFSETMTDWKKLY